MKTCPDCGWGIDPDYCWCGDAIEGHNYGSGHAAVPLGCTCGYADAEQRRNPEMVNREKT